MEVWRICVNQYVRSVETPDHRKCIPILDLRVRQSPCKSSQLVGNFLPPMGHAACALVDTTILPAGLLGEVARVGLPHSYDEASSVFEIVPSCVVRNLIFVTTPWSSLERPAQVLGSFSKYAPKVDDLAIEVIEHLVRRRFLRKKTAPDPKYGST